MRGLLTITVLVGEGSGFCLARATAFVIFAVATADSFMEALLGFFTPSDFAAAVGSAFEPAGGVLLSRIAVAVLAATPGLLDGDSSSVEEA